MHRNVQVRFGGGVTANPSGRTYPTQQMTSAWQCQIMRFMPFLNDSYEKCTRCLVPFSFLLHTGIISLVGELSMHNTSEFTAVVTGSMECLDDNLDYGPYYIDDYIHAASGATITDVIASLNVINRNNEWLSIWSLGSKHYHHELYRFHPKSVRIVDYMGYFVVGGFFTGDDIRWVKPVCNNDESDELHIKCDEILSNATIAFPWGHYSTAEQMRESVRIMLLADVDRRWRQHPDVLSIL
ncbi:hypothetical protein DZA65_00945 [Dickeya dianthicola]|nr:hypothetical protein [Dickeya dianthicola]AYC17850.1 hypothetical protein DZA65_00945 [Dickeya dianthicola]MBI0440211.1 hypothetical protein [Dickeya dianthicola]MBI0451199.1 hypothetical protein [Dickeya dianthicola]MBI0459958.1 hypothetical protein [Dickeya dianthicola]MBI0468740.1 hypothetical protein [Dickeya dianthicola]